jgi:predicted DsbA family dithiol-disulfide isomerase
MRVEPGTLVLWSDVACPWATLAVIRLCDTRTRLGLDDDVAIEHRPFSLELANERPTPKRVLEAEVPVAGSRAPDFGWKPWQDVADRWPVTTLLALEAVRAATAQDLRAAEQLDLALRRALFVESRCISMRHVILDVAAACDAVDVDALRHDLDRGTHRAALMELALGAKEAGVSGSPHVFLPNGDDVFNPGVELHWEGEHGKGFPVIDDDDPSVYDDLLKRAAAA